MGRLFKLALLLFPLLQVEGKTLKLKPKSSNEKEIPQIVANPSDASVIRGERVVLEREDERGSEQTQSSPAATKEASSNGRSIPRR